jgi:hypothetical protein
MFLLERFDLCCYLLLETCHYIFTQDCGGKAPPILGG